MRLLEVQAGMAEKRFINLDCVTELRLKKDGQIEIELIGRGFEIIQKGRLGHKDLLEVMKIIHSPASETSQLE